MSEHIANVAWSLHEETMDYDTFDRKHAWSFESGLQVPANWMKEDANDPQRIDPEIAVVAALSSCHMLTFLAIAAKKRLKVQRYEDRAVGTLADDGGKKQWITQIVLHPKVQFDKDLSEEALLRLHNSAHRNCFIANTIRSNVIIEPVVEQ